MVLVAASGNKICDPSFESYALEQPEMLRSPDYAVHHFSCRPLYKNNDSI